MKKVIFCLTLSGLFFAGCGGKKPPEPDPDQDVTIVFSTKPMSTSVATEEEKSITKVVIFGVDDKDNVIKAFPALNNPSSEGLKLSMSNNITRIFAIANPSSALEGANPSNVSDLMNLTGDFTNAPQSPFLMSGSASVSSAKANIELVRCIAKIEVSGEDGVDIQSVTVKNTPTKGFVFAQPTLTVPSSSGRVDYPKNNKTVLYVAENIKEDPTTLQVEFDYDGVLYNEPFEFTSNQAPVDIVRNTYYSVTVIPNDLEDTISFTLTIRVWDDVEIDDHYYYIKK